MVEVAPVRPDGGRRLGEAAVKLPRPVTAAARRGEAQGGAVERPELRPNSGSGEVQQGGLGRRDGVARWGTGCGEGGGYL